MIVSKSTNYLYAWIAVLIGLSARPVLAASVGTAAEPDRLVPIPACRLVDTRSDRPAQQGGVTRPVDIRTSYCGQVIPSQALGYAIRVLSYRRVGQDEAPAGQVSRHPVGPILSLGIPADADVVVDLEGYYLPPGVNLGPGTTHPGSPNSSTVELDPAPASIVTGKAGTNSVVEGQMGDLFLNAGMDQYNRSGVAALAKPSWPWIVAKTGDSGGGSGFGVFNSNNVQLLSMESNGIMRLNAGYYSGRTDYREGTAVAGNVVHKVQILNPSSDPQNPGAVTFFEATSPDEVSSPPTTKFRAYTRGSYLQTHINFDSQTYYHATGNHLYHFRAYSTSENRETFWVKPATFGDAVTNTRADMYVSGYTGLGTATAPAHTLDVGGSMTVGGGYASQTTAPANGLIIEGNVGIGTPNPNYKLEVVGNANFTGTVTGGNIQAKYQDVAEWVPASGDVPAGTVVIVDRSAPNRVTASQTAYDTTVAGVVSPQPGLILGVPGDDKALVATTGRVRVRVDATTSPITIGDLLVTSGKPGLAMRSTAMEINGRSFHQPGTILGKALEPLAGGEGEILVLLSLQ